MEKLDYPVLIEPLPVEDGGGFVATVPDLPGCMSDGETPEEALAAGQKQFTPRDYERAVEHLVRFFSCVADEIRSETARWAPLIRRLGLKVE